MPSDVVVPLDGGGSLRQRYLPLDRVGVCVPAAAAYPSTLLMTVVPAQVAGVPEIVVVAPPTKFGSENEHVLATCHELGVSTVLRVGGAQAVAAMAYGVEGLQRVDIVVGPGNLFVALAKEFVYGDVAIDSIAGPSEIVVVADEDGNPETISADMLAQAEHSPGSAILLTACESLADAVAAVLSRRLETLERADLTRDSLDRLGPLSLREITRNRHSLPMSSLPNISPLIREILKRHSRPYGTLVQRFLVRLVRLPQVTMPQDRPMSCQQAVRLDLLPVYQQIISCGAGASLL